jgi:hypothetical protein
MTTSRVVDLDAARAARAAAHEGQPVIRFGGKDWKLPNELPWAVAEAAGAGTAQSAVEAVKALLGKQWDAFAKLHPTVEDVRTLLEAIAELYNIDQGK